MLTSNQKKELFADLVFSELSSGRWQDYFNTQDGNLCNISLKDVTIEEAFKWGIAHEATIKITTEGTWNYWRQKTPVE